ncbi:ribosome maturation factor RimM [Sphingomonas turrisvirgatae]|uniref:Ribosome maturation factor RimM n=1 Tax=Sphingomonas turrisvirgatae TaxID=1888892 RepID=A0A1E3LQS9_9SPHN|nr:ribosome maturation factor RimM [Sphingomonas turrisvirgatae]ODP36111.1 16S rRNA processing protein RimM [Sphingomonas turrisvirgatae]
MKAPRKGEITLAVVIGAHGVSGEVRLKVFADDLSAHGSFNSGTLTLKSVRPGNNGAIARFAEVTDRNAADALRGTELTVARDSLPSLGEGEYYHADLLGLAVIGGDGSAIGTVASVENFGAGDVLEIERPDGKRFMVPMRAEAVPAWDEATLTIADGWAE